MMDKSLTNRSGEEVGFVAVFFRCRAKWIPSQFGREYFHVSAIRESFSGTHDRPKLCQMSLIMNLIISSSI